MKWSFCFFCSVVVLFIARSTLPACDGVPLGVHAFYMDGMRLLLAGPNRNLYLATRQLRRAAEHPQVSELKELQRLLCSRARANIVLSIRTRKLWLCWPSAIAMGPAFGWTSSRHIAGRSWPHRRAGLSFLTLLFRSDLSRFLAFGWMGPLALLFIVALAIVLAPVGIGRVLP
jgi:hypothetical protein